MHIFFSPLTHTKQLLLVTFCDKSAGIVTGQMTGHGTEKTDVNIEILM